MNSFTLQLTFRLAALVTATTAIVLAAGGWLLERQMTRGLEVLHEIEFQELAELIGPVSELTTAQITERLERDTEADAPLYYIQINDGKGLVLFRSRNLGAVMLPDLPQSDERQTVTLPPLGQVRISRFHIGGNHLLIASPLSTLRRLLREYASVCGILLGVVAIASVGLGYAFARFTLRPIRAMRETASRIRADNLSERIPMPAGHDEITALAELLNQMFDRLEASFVQVRNFTAVASHELKTPLSLIRLSAEKLRPRFSHDPEATATIADLLEETSRLHLLIESLLFMAKADSGALSIELKKIDPSAFVTDFAADAQLLADDKGVRFSLTRNDPGHARVAPDLVRQLLLNLLANAFAVSKPGCLVALDSLLLNHQWILTLTDEGPGLPVDQLARVFEPFVRFEHAGLTQSAAGTGLGLAISKSIVDLHGGTITAENRKDRSGLRITVSLPASV